LITLKQHRVGGQKDTVDRPIGVSKTVCHYGQVVGGIDLPGPRGFGIFVKRSVWFLWSDFVTTLHLLRLERPGWTSVILLIQFFLVCFVTKK